MSVARCSVFLLLAFAIKLGFCATTSTSSSTAPTTVPRPTPLQGSSPPSLNTSTVECEVDYYACNSTYRGRVCRCDRLCTQFGDCCADSQLAHNTTGPEFACVSTSVQWIPESDTTYWMIASCPKGELARELTGVAELCESQSLTSPPVSDNRTGLVYRNKYCAQCHSVPDKEHVTWQSQWRCSDIIQRAFDEGNATIDIALLLDSCQLLYYVQPLSLHSISLAPRTCDKDMVYTCQPPPGTDTSTAEYRALRDLCRSQPVDVRITESSSITLYKNTFCALCSTFGQGLKILCPQPPTPGLAGNVVFPPNTFAIFLDITGSGKVVIAHENIVVTSTVEQSCGEGQVFDVYSNVCRETLCQPGYIYNGTCLLLSLLSSNCTLIALNGTEYRTISNQIIFWTALQQNVSIQGYNSEGNPLVCTNFTTNFTTEMNETITRTLYGYPAAFAILSYLGLSVDVVAAAILLFTYAASCAKGQVFDVYRKMCRESPCQLGYSYNGSHCLPTASNCTPVALNSTEYRSISNQIIFWFALEQNVSVEGYNSDGNPLVCTNFTSNFTRTVNETITRARYGYPAAFAILTYSGLSVDVVAATILLLTYAAFAKMRTFYGKLFMNFVLVLLLGDLTFLLGTAVHGVSLEDVVCQVVAILLHYLFLARFVWMSLLSLNVARHLYQAFNFTVSEERESWRYLILYMAAGWLSPLLVLIVTVPLNYAVSGTVGYGVDGLCWMNQMLAIIVSFIAPLAICILFTTGAFVFVCIILAKLHKSDVNEDLQHKTGSRNCRVLVAVFCVTGVMWLFGFLALIDSALSWAWYIFIILNTTQAVFLTLAYICTAKVLRLYRTALTKIFRQFQRRYRDTLNSEGKQKDVELKSYRGTSNVTVSTIADKDFG